MRSLLAAVVLLSFVFAGAATAQSDDAPPGTPTNLVATAYGGTAGAIAWDRSTDDSGAVVGYEIVRDGAVLGAFDALSNSIPTFPPEPPTPIERTS